MRLVIFNRKLRLIILSILLLFLISACRRDNIVEQVDESETEELNIPILNMQITQVVDLDTVDKYSSKALIPTKITLGIDHPIVMNIQQRLMKLGFMEDDRPSTYYGSTTVDAIKKFQRQLEMEETGVCSADIYDILMSKTAPTYEARKGYVGEDISILQQRLYELSYFLNELEVTGYYGTTMENAVKALQNMNKLSETGTIDLITYNLMYSEDVIPYTINRQSPPDVIQIYQQKLQNLGYYLGAINGKYTEEFREAVKTYQFMNSQLIDGYIGPSTKFSIDSIYARPYTLYIGIRNYKVKQIQDRLVLLNYLSDRFANGYYGDYTGEAVAYFQKNNNIPMTGVVDAFTQIMIFSNEVKPGKESISSAAQFVMKIEDIRAFSQSNKKKGNADDLLRVAMLKLGAKYVWGMKGPNTFDCSGFVYWCLQQVGVEVQYMTTYNWRFSTQFEKVEKFDDLQMGDLILINGHMGIVSDDMTVIDASSSNGQVVHRDLDDWWRERFMMGFRIFAEENTEAEGELVEG